MRPKPIRMFSRAALTLLVMLLTTATAWAWDGSGTAESPYQIKSTADLNQLATDVNSGTEHEGDYFVLNTDLTYSHETDWNDASSTENNFTPIGGYNNNYYRYFKGHFDGQGHTISGIRIYQSGSETEKRYAALFGQLSNGAEVKNVFLADARFTGYYYCGPIVGINYNGRVENCHVLSDVTVHAVTTNAYHHGGVVGFNVGTITGCTSAASITAAVSCKYNGGITGQGSGTVEDCIYFGSTVAGDSYVGAIIGYAASGSTVRNCYYINDGIASAVGGYNTTSATVTDVRLATSDDFAVSGDTYTIGTAAGWSVMCAALCHNDTYNRFSGKTVQLDADITVSRMAGSAHHDFCGTFDGQGNTLTVNISSDDITDGSTQYVAPFRYVSNTKADPSDEADSPAAFRNLHVTGTITTDKQFTGGLIGGCWGTVSIDNCAVSTAITSTISGDGTHGGIVGIQQNGALTITGCLFDGRLLGATTYAVGGFIGWRKSGAEIRNSLFAPAEVTVQNDGSATFARNKVDTYNSYYTYYLCDGTNYAPYDPADADHPDKYNNGHATRTVTPAADVTIEAVALTGDATEYTVSGITAYSGGGLQLGETLYYGSGDQLSLTLSNSATGAPAGYRYDTYTASAGTLSGTTLTMPDEDVTISVNTAALRSTGQPVTVAYINADGTAGEASAIAIDGTETSLGTYDQEKWYFVGTDISHTGEITCRGDVHIILCDGKTMNVDGNGSYALWSPFGNFYFYGQNGQTGTLNATGRIAAADNHAGTLTINGGIINATGDYGISAYGLIINRGTVNATGNDGHGIWSGGNITLGWNKPTDRISITASSYSYSGTVAVADGKMLYNGSEVLSGTVSDLDLVNGKTLAPCLAFADNADNTALVINYAGKEFAAVQLSGRTLTKDGNWNTLCLPFSMTAAQIAASPLAGATIKTMDNTSSGTRLDNDGTLTLKFNTATSIEAGKPYIIKWTTTGDNIVNPVFQGVTISSTTPTAVVSNDKKVTFVGQYSPFSIVNSGATGDNEGNKNEILLMTKGNKIGYSKNPRTLNCFRCHFYVPTNGGQQAHSIEVDFGEGETTSLSEELRVKSEECNATLRSLVEELTGSWYSLDGRKLEGKPTAKGMYIVNGRKVIIK